MLCIGLINLHGLRVYSREPGEKTGTLPRAFCSWVSAFPPALLDREANPYCATLVNAATPLLRIVSPSRATGLRQYPQIAVYTFPLKSIMRVERATILTRSPARRRIAYTTLCRYPKSIHFPGRAGTCVPFSRCSHMVSTMYRIFGAFAPFCLTLV